MTAQYTYRYKTFHPEDVVGYLGEQVHLAVHAKYGREPDEAIWRRVNEEWVMLEETDSIFDVLALYELTEWLKENRYPYWIRGCGGSSLILYLLGITSGNPLPPHKWCPNCKQIKWMPKYKDGFDIRQGECCSRDGARLVTDGHDIPWQTLLGYDGHQPTFDIDVPEELYETIHRDWQSHWLRDETSYREVCYESTVRDHVKVIKLSKLSVCFLWNNASTDFYEYEYGALERRYMLDEAGALFEQREWQLPEPKSVADLLALYGLDHMSADCEWNADCREMLDDMGYEPSELIAFRDDVYQLLRKYGIGEEEAWRAMEQVRRGKGLPNLDLPELTEREERILAQCQHICCLFPKSHAVEHILYQLKSREYY
ncbi:MAG: hypothetical protein J6B02_03365 [Selenomonadales bacterium]|nr:hypothetical protein [Selenomonadales bacterium]